MLSSATFPLNVCIILSDPFSDRSSSYVICVFNHCRRMNQDRSTMGLMSSLSCLFSAFYSYGVLFLGLLELVSFKELYFFDDEYENYGSVSGYPGTFNFPCCSGNSIGSIGESVGSVSGVGSGDFVPNGIEALGDIVPLVVFFSPCRPLGTRDRL